MALRRIIRDALAFDPLITMQALERVVEKKINRSIDNAYLVKLVGKVRKQVMTEVERTTADTRVAEIRESYRTIIEELRRLAYNDTTPPNEKRKCLDSVAKIQDMQAKLEMDLGLFTRQLGTINVDHRMKPIDEGTRSSIVAAFRAWGMSPPEMRRIEAQATIVPKAEPITNDTPQPPKSPIVAPAKTIIPALAGAGLVSTE